MRRAKTKSKPDSKAKLGRVLVVEDDAILSMSLEAALLDAGASEVIVCPSIAATMEALEAGPVDAVVLDVHLRDRDDGWAVAELVDLLGPRRPRVVFSTGSPGDIPPEVAEMGAVFEKPYDPAQLAAALSDGTREGLFARLRSAIS